MSGNNNNEQQWHLSKSVPISVIFMVVLQASVGIWWMSALAGDVDKNYNEMRMRTEDRISSAEVMSALAVRDARIESNASSVTRVEAVINRMDGKLDRLLERWSVNAR